MKYSQEALGHFLDLVTRGSDPLASDGEHRAHRLAQAVLDNVAGLDGQAIDGLHAFVELAVGSPDTARDIVPA